MFLTWVSQCKALKFQPCLLEKPSVSRDKDRFERCDRWTIGQLVAGVLAAALFRLLSLGPQCYAFARCFVAGSYLEMMRYWWNGWMDDTVDGRNPAPVEVGSLSHYLRVFLHPRWLFGISEPSTVETLDIVFPLFHGWMGLLEFGPSQGPKRSWATSSCQPMCLVWPWGTQRSVGCRTWGFVS